jgi:predicted chitinase
MFNWLRSRTERKLMSALSDLQAAVAANTQAISAVVAQRALDRQTITELQQRVSALAAQVTDEAALAALTAELNASAASLA